MDPQFEPIGTYNVIGVPISVVTPDLAATLVESWARDDVGRFVCFRDVASLMTIAEDETIRDLHHDATIVAPDGMPLAMIGKFRGFKVRRTCGPDFMDQLMRRSVQTGLRHYFYGGKEGVAKQLKEHFEAKYTGVAIVGYESPPFAPVSDEPDLAALARFKESKADVVWIGLSSPKQDVWMWRNYRHASQTLLGVGAAFDFHSGSVDRAPFWMQKMMLEWFHRLLQEPQRLWRRYLVLVPRFLVLLAIGRSPR
ncbi:WecB/TagA/CpsF family glycosyltransferase [Sphingomonas sp. IC081]|uniref:WecB/TagA/CpsF family glycosyltransferase n=1 Tax=Sphingomonas sp. IC081 TaxID=304378 RepID=UPI00163C392D|nr:WecB/TagA/CpsF family glycosyltransferase [Sphingomonas sp. IC081]